MKLPIREIEDLGKEILSENHALYPDMLQCGFLGYLEHESLSAAEKAMRDYLKKERRFQRGFVPLRETDEPLNPEDPEKDLEDDDHSERRRELARWMSTRLPVRERKVFELRCSTDPAMPQREVAKRLRITPRQVQSAEDRAIKRIRDYLAEYPHKLKKFPSVGEISPILDFLPGMEVMSS